MGLIVQKYGGTSLATSDLILRAAERICAVKRGGKDVVVVVSAMGSMTDELFDLSHQITKRPPKREMDMLLTAGERISMALLAMALDSKGVAAISFTGSQCGIVTTNQHSDAKIIDVRAGRILESLKEGKVVIVAGFQGVSETKEITTLGRGGSDTTAVALTAVLGAEYCEILTDVEGLFDADPRLVPAAKLLDHCSYDEAIEMASLGAKMHARSLQLAKRFSVRVGIGSSANTKSLGTWITDERREKMENTVIRSIATRSGYHFFRAQTSVGSFFQRLNGASPKVRFISGGSQSVQFLCEETWAADVNGALTRMGVEFEEIEGVGIVSAVGEGIEDSESAMAEFLTCLFEVDTPCFLIHSNLLSLTAAIPKIAMQVTAERLHERLVQKKRERS